MFVSYRREAYDNQATKVELSASTNILFYLLDELSGRFYFRRNIFLGGIVGTIIICLFTQSLQSGIVFAFFDGKESSCDIVLSECTNGPTMRTYAMPIMDKQGRYCMEQSVIKAISHIVPIASLS